MLYGMFCFNKLFNIDTVSNDHEVMSQERISCQEKV